MRFRVFRFHDSPRHLKDEVSGCSRIAHSDGHSTGNRTVLPPHLPEVVRRFDRWKYQRPPAGRHHHVHAHAMQQGIREGRRDDRHRHEGRKIRGARKPSSEMAMHLLIYEMRPDIMAVVHAHPAHATAYAAAGIPLNKALISEVVLALGCIPLAEYGTPGTPELTDQMRPFIQNYDALLMSNHGVVTYGTDLEDAFNRMDTVEHFAKISMYTRILGRERLLSPVDVEKLWVQRQKYYGLEDSEVNQRTRCVL